MSDPSQEKGFVVVDRRASAGASDEEPAPAAEAPRAPTGNAPGPQAAGPAAGAPPSPVGFAMLVQSFFVTALYHLGLAADPETGRPSEPNLPAARQNIEILELLEVKTRGNLEEDERLLLEKVLYELRMSFVEASQARKKE